jgi:diketogulonate reductase-like aldo/keto reductase
MVLEETYTLANGVEIPKLGLGTWFISDDKAGQAVKDAVEIGYRHIDTAQAYDNERGVGEGVSACGVDRADLFVTAKLAAEVKSYAEAVVSIDGPLKTMGLSIRYTLQLGLLPLPKTANPDHMKDRFCYL